MNQNIRGIGLGLTLIALCGAVLLVSDWNRRVKPTSKLPVISVFQFSPRDLLNESVEGCLDSLAARGFKDGSGIVVRRFNADADISVANSIASTIADSDSSMVVTVSTPALQVMAAVNRRRQMTHLFGTVTDPYQSGVGISRENPEARPPYLAGIGTFQPVKEVWRLAKRVKPDLKVVGEIWCTSETCSEACTVLGREVAEELGIKLIEIPVSTSSEITDATRALIERGVQAIWIGGDNIVELAAPTVIEMALQSGIPVFANAPVHAENGALLGLGADYYQVGEALGRLAADVLEGRDPLSVPVENVVPPLLYVNTNIISRLREKWVVPDDILESAAYVFGPPKPEAQPIPVVDKTERKIGVFYYGPDPMIDRGLAGLRRGLKGQGYVEGENLRMVIQHAQSDISQIPQLVRNLDESGLDVLTPMTTPCLTATLALARKTPVVFTLVYNPIAAGAGADFTNHLPNVTGIGSFPPLEDTMDFIQRLLPDVRKVGTVYNQSEINSTIAVELGEKILRERGVALIASVVAGSSELHTATLALIQRGAEIIWITGDNTVISGFAAVSSVARDAGVALVCNDFDMLEQGATAAIGFNPFDSGFAVAEPIARVLKGDKPADIPIRNISIRETALNPAQARERNLNVFDNLLKDVDVLTGPPVKHWRIAIVQQVSAPAIDESRDGFMTGLKEAGLEEDRDFTVKALDAQGEVSMLNSLLDTAVAWQADMVVTITTPALQTAMRKVQDRPVVFALSVDPLLIGGSGTHERHQPNVTGVFDRSPFEEMIALIKECLPDAVKIGTLFAPSEVNSVIFKDEFERVARENDMELIAIPADSRSEAGPATRALAQRGADLVCQINDNQNNAAFPAIVKAAQTENMPVFAFSSGLAEQGAAVTLSNDHYDGGREAAALAARVMRGQSPASLPYRGIKKTKLVVNRDAARNAGLELPESVLRRAE